MHDKGYTLFSGEQIAISYKEYELDIATSVISKNYISAQRRIDSMLNTQISRWNFSISNLYSDEVPIVAYGCQLPIKDDKDRIGVSFIHAIESSENLPIDKIVVHIAQLLLPETIQNITQYLAEIAQGISPPTKIISFLIQKFKFQTINRLKSNGETNYISPIKKIEHDCGGASALAWLSITKSHLDILGPWEIYEEYEYSKKLVSTLSSCRNAKKTYYLCEYMQLLSLGVSNASLAPPHRLEHQLPQSTSDQQPAIDSFNKEELSKTENYPTQYSIEYSNQSELEYPQKKHRRIQRSIIPKNCFLVELVQPITLQNHLLLTEKKDKSTQHELNYKNLTLANGDHQDYYEFKFDKKKYFWQKQEIIHLCLLKQNLTNYQKHCVDKFIEKFYEDQDRHLLTGK
ncbi:MAG: hypothetical protein KDJ52_15765 [Anaerolineae bacterium]|nr:hypothetical protein [Anaerolineae bacterium]